MVPGEIAVRSSEHLDRKEKIAEKHSIQIKGGSDVMLIGVVADAGCGNPTFMKRLTGLFGAANVGNAMCLNDYGGNAIEKNIDLMHKQLKDLKAGKTIKKSNQNQEVIPASIMIVEGSHQLSDPRISQLLDFSIYFEIADEVKQAWDVKSVEGSQFESQRVQADIVMQVLPSELNPNDKDTLKVKFIQQKEKVSFDPAFLFDKDTTAEWTPCGTKLTCSSPGIKLRYGLDSLLGKRVTVLEMDGKFDKMEEIMAVEEHLCGTATKYCGELTQQMMRTNGSPGSNNGLGFFQTLAGFKIRQSLAAQLAAAGLGVTALFAPIPALAGDIEAGEVVFQGNCLACHGGGRNVIIPERTLLKDALDTYLEGGRTEPSVVNQVTYGKNAMPAFGGRLSAEDIADVAAYVIDQANGDKWDIPVATPPVARSNR
jgi:phosphoribulokinase